MQIINTGNLYTSRKITPEEYAKIHEICGDCYQLEVNTLDTNTEISFDEYPNDNIEDTIRALLDAEVPIVSGEIEYWGNRENVWIENKVYVRRNKSTCKIVIDTVGDQENNLSEISDEILVNELKKRGYRVSRGQDAALEIPTSAGVIKAYQSADPGQPGICVILQPKDNWCEVDLAYICTYEDESYKTSYNEEPEDVCIMTYGNIFSEDYTSKVLIRRDDVIAALSDEDDDDEEKE